MVIIEAKTKPEEKLGGKSRKAKRGKSSVRKNSLRYTPKGYIRCKKAKGPRGILRYYFYCYAEKQPDGSFKEICEYLGTADFILKVVHDAKQKE